MAAPAATLIRMAFLNGGLYVIAEAIYVIGISTLIYRLIMEKTCAGLSLISQELTAIFLAVRLCCNFVMGYDIHLLLDSAILLTTLWLIYMIRFKLRYSYMDDQDNIAIYYVLIPCSVLSLVIHPTTQRHILYSICWIFCVCLEAASVLFQFRIMQKTKIVEPFKHYVFAFGVARFFSIAYWIFQIYVVPQIPIADASSIWVFSSQIDGSICLVMIGIFFMVFASLDLLHTPAPHTPTTDAAFTVDAADIPRRSNIPLEFRDYIIKTLDRTPYYRDNIRRRRT